MRESQTGVKECLRRAGAIWILLLVLYSLQPFRLHVAPRSALLHPIAHILAFGTASLVPSLFSASLAQLWTRALWLLCLGASIEVSQGLIYRQRTEWADLVADGIGILIVSALTMLWRGGGSVREI